MVVKVPDEEMWSSFWRNQSSLDKEDKVRQNEWLKKENNKDRYISLCVWPYREEFQKVWGWLFVGINKIQEIEIVYEAIITLYRKL